MLEVYHVSTDRVISSQVGIASCTYNYALGSLFPLVNRFGEQRKIQRPKFYERLKKDIIKGCVMPPITLAFVVNGISQYDTPDKVEAFVRDNIENGYILDGMQRLNTLNSASQETDSIGGLSMYVNVVLAEQYDHLLYRMITLNNGQKPMSVRHQVEMLTKSVIANIVDNQSFHNMHILSEKETEQVSPVGSIRRADVVSAYMAFLTNSVSIQSSKIIEEKLDEILVAKLMENDSVTSGHSFRDTLLSIDRLCSVTQVKSWFQNENNLIGFAVGTRKSLAAINSTDPDQFYEQIKLFEEAFSILQVSKINVGKMRRQLGSVFFRSHFNSDGMDGSDLSGVFLEELVDP